MLFKLIICFLLCNQARSQQNNTKRIPNGVWTKAFKGTVCSVIYGPSSTYIASDVDPIHTQRWQNNRQYPYLVAFSYEYGFGEAVCYADEKKWAAFFNYGAPTRVPNEFYLLRRRDQTSLPVGEAGYDYRWITVADYNDNEADYTPITSVQVNDNLEYAVWVDATPMIDGRVNSDVGEMGKYSFTEHIAHIVGSGSGGKESSGIRIGEDQRDRVSHGKILVVPKIGKRILNITTAVVNPLSAPRPSRHYGEELVNNGPTEVTKRWTTTINLQTSQKFTFSAGLKVGLEISISTGPIAKLFADIGMKVTLETTFNWSTEKTVTKTVEDKYEAEVKIAPFHKTIISGTVYEDDVTISFQGEEIIYARDNLTILQRIQRSGVFENISSRKERLQIDSVPISIPKVNVS